MTLSQYAVERKHARYSLDARAKLSTGGREITVRTVDISEGGVGLVSPIELPEGSSYVVEFEFPGMPGVFRAEVRARSKVGFRHGFIFVCLDEGNMALLRKFERRRGILTKDVHGARS